MATPRIGIIGSGAIGGLFGALLVRAGFDVHFLLRSEYQAIAQNGLQVNSKKFGDIRLASVQAYDNVANMPPCDWLLIGTKAVSNRELAPLIAAAAAPGARILFMQNGLGIEEQVRSALPNELHIIGVPCWVGVQRTKVGTIDHMALGYLHIGYHSGPADGRAGAREDILGEIVDVFTNAQVEVKAVDDLDYARWHKLVWNIPFNGLCALLEARTGDLLTTPDTRELVREMMEEVIAAAMVCGQNLPDGLAEQTIALTETFPEYLPSMYLDNMQRRPMELDVMYEIPISTARRRGYTMAKVDALLRALRFIDARNLRHR